MLSKSTFKPSYIWPNPAFPFRIYYESNKCRIFIIENIQHNWQWLSTWHEKFRKNDFFFVYCGWYHSLKFAEEADEIFSILNLSKENFFFLYNSPLEMANFSSRGFNGDLINHNAWLDENALMRPLNLPKIYDAIYVARRSLFKRHGLASRVKKLALIAGMNHGNAVAEVPEYQYLNTQALSPEEVCYKINQSCCGLLLSAEEGACFASSEYLLCGIPVVSTPSKGGRDVWYNDYNAIICEADENSVSVAVDFFVKNPRDPEKIRNMHIAQANKYRQKFIQAIELIFQRFEVTEVDAYSFFGQNFMHKLRKSYKPNFQDIFQ